MLMLKGRAKAIAHAMHHFGDPAHRIWRVEMPVTWLQDLLSGGTAADVAVLCECGVIFEQHLPTKTPLRAVNE